MCIRRFVLPLLLVLSPLTLVRAQERTWSRLGDLSVARSNCAAVYIGSGKILVMGGSTGIPLDDDPQAIPQSICEIVDVWQGQFYHAEPMSLPRSEFVALATPDSDVIVIGGVIGIDPNGEVTGRIERYSRTTGRWTTIGNLKTARRQHAAGFIDDHRILVVGGRIRNYASLTDAEIFDLRTGTCTAAAAFPFPINASTMMTSFDGSLVVVGGRTSGANSPRREEVYAYDAGLDQWVLNGVLAQSVAFVTGLRLWDRRIIIAGGAISDGPLRTTPEVQLESFGKWKLGAPMSVGRSGAALGQWTENRIMVLGGVNDDRVPGASTEWIDMNQHTTSSGPSLEVPRDRFVALSVPTADGLEPHLHSIVAIGGLKSRSALTGAVEVLAPIDTRVARGADGH
jgi:hypothetical protein